jgi:hypothetical protein
MILLAIIASKVARCFLKSHYSAVTAHTLLVAGRHVLKIGFDVMLPSHVIDKQVCDLPQLYEWPIGCCVTTHYR